jgi:hypothetical protein
MFWKTPPPPSPTPVEQEILRQIQQLSEQVFALAAGIGVAVPAPIQLRPTQPVRKRTADDVTVVSRETVFRQEQEALRKTLALKAGSPGGLIPPGSRPASPPPANSDDAI